MARSAMTQLLPGFLATMWPALQRLATRLGEHPKRLAASNLSSVSILAPYI